MAHITVLLMMYLPYASFTRWTKAILLIDWWYSTLKKTDCIPLGTYYSTLLFFGSYIRIFGLGFYFAQ